MRLILHHTIKDLRALWPYLAVWAGVLAAHLLVPDDGLLAEGAERAVRLRTVLQMIQWALAAVLPAMLILQDPVDGTRSFWLTRPISRGALLASKALSLTIFFILLPLAVQLAGLLRAGLGGWPLAAGLAEAGLQIAGITLGFAALASATSSLARFVLLLAVYSAVTTIAGPALMLIDPQPWGPSNWLSLSSSREIARIFLLIVLAVVGLVHQWLTRRTRRTLALAGIAAVAMSWASVWPWDFLSHPARPLQSATAFDLQPADDPRCFEHGSDPRRVALCGRFLFPNPAADGDLEVQHIESRLVLPDGTSIGHRGRGHMGPTYARLVDPGTPSGDPAIPGDPSLSEAFQTLLHPTRQEYQRHARTPGTLEIDLLLASFEVKRLGAMPIEEGARFRVGTAAAAVERVAVSGGSWPGVELDLRLNSIHLLFAPRDWSQVLNARPEHRVDGPVFSASSGSTSRTGRFLPLPRPTLRSVREQQTLSLRDSPGLSGPDADVPATATEVRQWLRDVEIVLRHRVQTGAYRATLRIDDFRMADYAAGGAG